MDHNAQTTQEIEGVQTELLIQSYGDAVLVLVTQLGKVGNLMQLSIPATTPLRPPPVGSAFPEPPVSIQITNLLGAPPSEHIGDLYSLYATQIAAIVWTQEEIPGTLPAESGRRNIIVGLALKAGKASQAGVQDSGLTDGERKMFVGVMEMLTSSLKRQAEVTNAS